MNITITVDGKVFNGTDLNSLVSEINAYEANLKLKKEEDERKKKEADKLKQDGLKEIKEHVAALNNMIDEYQKTTGEPLFIMIFNNKLSVEAKYAVPYYKALDSIYR